MLILEHDKEQLHRSYIPVGEKEQKIERGRRPRREKQIKTNK